MNYTECYTTFCKVCVCIQPLGQDLKLNQSDLRGKEINPFTTEMFPSIVSYAVIFKMSMSTFHWSVLRHLDEITHSRFQQCHHNWTTHTQTELCDHLAVPEGLESFSKEEKPLRPPGAFCTQCCPKHYVVLPQKHWAKTAQKLQGWELRAIPHSYDLVANKKKLKVKINYVCK